MTVLRKAYVKVAPDTRGFSGELNRNLRAIDTSTEGRRAGASFGAGFTAKVNDKLRALGATAIDIRADPAQALAAVDLAETQVRELGREASSLELRLSANQALGDLGRLRKRMGGFGDEAGRDMSAGMGRTLTGGLQSSLSELPSLLRGNLILVAGTMGAVMAPVIGAALTAGILGAVGGGVIAAGIAAAAKSPVVKAAWAGFTATAKTAFAEFGRPFEGPLARAAGTFSAAMARMAPTINALGRSLAPIIDSLAPALASMAERALPGIASAARASAPLFQQIAASAPQIGAAVGQFFQIISRNGPAAAAFIRDLAGAIAGAIVYFGKLIASLTTAYAQAGVVVNHFRAQWDFAWSAVRTVTAAVAGWFTGTIMPSIRQAINQGAAAFRFLQTVGRIVWQSLQQTISIYWGIIRGVFVAIRSTLTIVWTAFRTFGQIGILAWRTLSAGIRAIWTSIRTGSFQPLRDFITKTLPGAFRTGVSAIGRAWDTIRAAASRPVEFVVHQVINPLIRGYNRIAGVFGARRATEIAFGTGGGNNAAPRAFSGFARGGRIPGAASLRDNRLAMAPDGPLAVASGEFITNARSTMANLPLIAAINNKRGKVGRRDVDPYLDGAARGGLVGDGIGDFLGRVWRGFQGAGSFIADPVKGLRRVAGAAMDRIPGAGPIVRVLRGMGGAIISGIAKLLSGFGGGALGGGGVAGGWRGMRALIAARFPGLGMISGFRPGARTLSGSQSYHALGRAVDYPPVRALAAWIRGTYGARTKELITPWQDLNLWNGRPHTYHGAVWNQHNFAGGNAHVHWAMANGGVVREPVFGVGRSGRTYSFGERGPETVTPGTGGTVHIHFHNSVITSRQAAEDLVVDAVRSARKNRRLT